MASGSIVGGEDPTVALAVIATTVVTVVPESSATV